MARCNARFTQRSCRPPISFQPENLHLAVAPVPEPSTYAMVLAGLALVGFVTRRRRDGSRADG
jgi:hypothetical protein